MLGIIVLIMMVFIFIVAYRAFGNLKDTFCKIPLLSMLCGRSPLGFLEDYLDDIENAIIEPIQDGVMDVYNDAKGEVMSVVHKVEDLGNEIATTGEDVIYAVKDGVLDGVYTVVDGTEYVFNDVKDGIMTGVHTVIDRPKEIAEDIGNEVQDAIDKINSAVNFAKHAYDAAIGWVTSTVNNITHKTPAPVLVRKLKMRTIKVLKDGIFYYYNATTNVLIYKKYIVALHSGNYVMYRIKYVNTLDDRYSLCFYSSAYDSNISSYFMIGFDVWDYNTVLPNKYVSENFNNILKISDLINNRNSDVKTKFPNIDYIQSNTKIIKTLTGYDPIATEGLFITGLVYSPDQYIKTVNLLVNSIYDEIMTFPNIESMINETLNLPIIEHIYQ